MAKIYDLPQDAWEEWLATLPKHVRDMAAQYPPNILYQLDTGNLLLRQ